MPSEDQLKLLVVQLAELDRLHRQISEAAEQEVRDLRLHLRGFARQLTDVLEHLRIAYENSYQRPAIDEIWMQAIKILKEMVDR